MIDPSIFNQLKKWFSGKVRYLALTGIGKVCVTDTGMGEWTPNMGKIATNL